MRNCRRGWARRAAHSAILILGVGQLVELNENTNTMAARYTQRSTASCFLLLNHTVQECSTLSTEIKFTVARFFQAS